MICIARSNAPSQLNSQIWSAIWPVELSVVEGSRRCCCLLVPILATLELLFTLPAARTLPAFVLLGRLDLGLLRLEHLKRVEITSTRVAFFIAFLNSSPFFAAAAGSMAAKVIGWLFSMAKSAAVFPPHPSSSFSVVSAPFSIRNLAVAVCPSVPRARPAR